MSRAAVSLVCLALLVAGCGRPIDTAILSANAAAVSLDAANEILSSRYRADQLAAARRAHGDPASAATKAERRDRVEAVRLNYRPAWAAYSAARSAWLSLAQGIGAAIEAEARGASVPEVELVLLVQALARAQTELIRQSGARGIDL